ncbi:MAG: endopeptidase La [Erysipelotrichaceae bacterium]|nr:endopeptidase La [Erysipelotrichaceae bacterium]
MENREGYVLGLWNTMILPNVDARIRIRDMGTSLRRLLDNGRHVFVALPAKNAQQSEFHSYGVTFEMQSIEHTAKGDVLKIHTGQRVRIIRLTDDSDLQLAQFEPAPETVDMDETMQQQMLGYLKQIVMDINKKINIDPQFTSLLDSIHDINTMIMYLSQYMNLTANDRYEFLKTDSLRERSLHFMDSLIRQRESVDWNMQINERISNKANHFYREQMLKEQLKAIQDELNEGKETKEDDYASRIEAAHMPEEIRKAALEELDKLNAQPQGSPEISVLQNHLDFMLALPWESDPQQDIDLKKAEKILNDDHYGLEKVKQRILEHLAILQLRKDKKGSILLLVGPPGTGKTSLGKSIAHALDRKYVRMSLGGVRDESEIRGHRRTYVGAMPGRVLQSIKQAGSKNPVMILDEVDKLTNGGFSGDPSSALLEVLDPEQNDSFTDHYLDLPYDLSEVFFIATANSLETIPGPLLDRMEIIQISGYTSEEKMHIAKDHLMENVLKEHGLSKDQLIISDEVLQYVIDNYTAEAGVRGLKKQLAAIARVAAARIVAGDNTPFTPGIDELEDLLGRKITHHELAGKKNPIGVVTGLAWTPVGGEILFIETTDMPGSGDIILTGQLGDVMKESARISFSLLKSRLPLNVMNFKEKDIHIHVPSGSIPKDGPSAGIALFTALASLCTGRPVDPKLAMTGEITLRGQVMPIGGLKEKLLGAARAGITKVLIPKENVQDLKEVPQSIKEQIEIIPVETVEEVLKETLDMELPRLRHKVYPQSFSHSDNQ